MRGKKERERERDKGSVPEDKLLEINSRILENHSKTFGSRLTLKPASLPDRSAAAATAASRRASGQRRSGPNLSR